MADSRRRLAELLAKCHNDPCLFNHAILRRPSYWWRQVELARAVARYDTTVAVAGNSVGKDYLVGGIVPWWLLTRHNSLVVVTGPSQSLLGSVTWKEIRRAIEGSPFKIGARISEGVKASPLQVDLGNGWGALGLASNTVERLSGQHAPNLLAIVEEASGCGAHAWEAIRSLNPRRTVVIGNPLSIGTEYHGLALTGWKHAEAGDVPDNERVYTCHIPSTDSPDLHLDRSPRGLADGGFLARCDRDYGRSSLWWKSHIDALFPESNYEDLVPKWWLDAAGKAIRKATGGRRALSIDLAAGTGRDRTVFLIGDEHGLLHGEASARMSVSEAAHRAAALCREWGIRPEDIVYDAGNLIGDEFPAQAARYGLVEMVPYRGNGSGGNDATNKRSRNARRLRKRLDPDGQRWRTDADDQALSMFHGTWKTAGDLVVPKAPFSVPGNAAWWLELRAELEALQGGWKGRKYALEKKEDLAARLKRSPDWADACLMLAEVLWDDDEP